LNSFSQNPHSFLHSSIILISNPFHNKPDERDTGAGIVVSTGKVVDKRGVRVGCQGACLSGEI